MRSVDPGDLRPAASGGGGLVREEATTLRRYAVAVLLVGAMTLARWLLPHWLAPLGVFAIYYPVVIVAALYGGIGPGLLATALGTAVVGAFFNRLETPRQPAMEMLRLALFAATGVVFSALVQAFHVARRRAALLRVRRSQREAEDRHRLALDAGHMGSWEWNSLTGRVTRSESVDRLMGFEPGTFPSTREAFFNAIHPEDRQAVEKCFREAAERGGDCEAEFRVVWPDGSIHWTLDKGRVFRDGRSQPARMIGVLMDITDRKIAEAALRDSEARARAVLETAVFGIITINPRGTVNSLNPAAERIFGYRAEEVIGHNVSMLMPSPYREEHDAYLHNYLSTGLKKIIGTGREVVGRRKDGSIFPMDLAVSEMIVGGQRMFTGLVHDISDRKRAEEEMRRAKEAAEEAHRQAEAANRMKDDFLATLSHELRTPLNAMLGWARLMRMGNMDEETTRQAVEAIERNALTQAQLIEDLLDVSRITSGKLRLDVRQVDLTAVINAAIDSVSPAAQAKQIRLVRLLDAHAGPVLGDATRLQQVIWNLLSNAIKFTPRGGRVQVNLQRAGSDVQIIVSDTGRGISPDFLPHVFERFRQADSSSTRLHGGLGLGLAIVRHLVELHGGAIEVESAGEGRGATFTVSLPLAATRLRDEDAEGQEGRGALVSAAKEDCPPSLDGVRVLVVDDEPDACQLIRTALGQCHADVRTAASADEAMRIFPDFRPDVMVSDIGMPGQDGYDLIRKVRALPPEKGGRTPAIALTAFARAEDRVKSLAAGFQTHIAKPVEPAELATAVASVAK